MRGLFFLGFVGVARAINDCEIVTPVPAAYKLEVSQSNQPCSIMKDNNTVCERYPTCADGYSTTTEIKVTCKKAASGLAPLQFSGCQKNNCTNPSVAPEGYNITGLSCNKQPIGISGDMTTVACTTPATCATGYVGTVKHTCPTSGELVLTGCGQIPCKVNSGMTVAVSYDRMPNTTTGLVTAAQLKNIKCNTIGTWEFPDFATKVTDYKLINALEPAKATCPTHGGDFVLSGCEMKKNCSEVIQYRPNMVADSAHPCPSNMLLTHKLYCAVACKDGYHLKEKKFDTDGKKVKNYPQHPVCVDGVLNFDADCVEDANFTVVFIILGVLVFGLILVPVVQYFMQVTAFNKKKSEGFSWNGKGELLNSAGEVVKDGVVESSLD